MNWKRHFIEAVTLIIAAVACALVANAVASSQRKLNVVPTFAAPPPSARAGAPVTGDPSTASVAPPSSAAVSKTTTATPGRPKIAAEDRGALRNLITVLIETGRTHQIRVHLASIGHPVVGDRRYGGAKAKRLMLHAWKLEHPSFGAIEAAPPDDLIRSTAHE